MTVNDNPPTTNDREEPNDLAEVLSLYNNKSRRREEKQAVWDIFQERENANIFQAKLKCLKWDIDGLYINDDSASKSVTFRPKTCTNLGGVYRLVDGPKPRLSHPLPSQHQLEIEAKLAAKSKADLRVPYYKTETEGTRQTISRKLNPLPALYSTSQTRTHFLLIRNL
jgi:hypothetical protein